MANRWSDVIAGLGREELERLAAGMFGVLSTEDRFAGMPFDILLDWLIGELGCLDVNREDQIAPCGHNR